MSANEKFDIKTYYDKVFDPLDDLGYGVLGPEAVDRDELCHFIAPAGRRLREEHVLAIPKATRPAKCSSPFTARIATGWLNFGDDFAENAPAVGLIATREGKHIIFKSRGMGHSERELIALRELARAFAWRIDHRPSCPDCGASMMIDLTITQLRCDRVKGRPVSVPWFCGMPEDLAKVLGKVCEKIPQTA